MEKSKKNLIYLFVAIVLGFILKIVVPASNGLTSVGVTAIAIFIPTAFLWVTGGTDWVSMLCIIALIMFGVMPSTQAFSLSFGSFLIPAITAFIILSNAVGEVGLMKRIAVWFISRKFVEKRPYVFMFMFAFASLVITMVSSMMISVLLFSALGAEICDNLGYTKKDKFYRILMLTTLWNSIVGEGLGAIGKGGYLIMLSIMQGGFGIDVPLFKYLLMSLPLALVYLMIILLIFRFVIKPDTSKFGSYDVIAMRKEYASTKITTQAKITAVIYCIVIVSCVLPSATFLPRISSYLNSISIVAIPTLGVIFLSLIPIGGKPIINFSDQLQKVPWGIVVFSAGMLLFSSAMNIPELGISTCLTNVLQPISEIISPLGIVVFAIIISAVLTQVISNLVAVSVIISSFTPVILTAFNSGHSSIHPASFAVCISIISYFSFLTPAACTIAPIILGPRISTKEGLLPSAILLVLAVAATCLISLPIGNVVFS